MNDVDGFLRNSLRANAAFSLVSGLGFALAGGAVASFLGVAPAGLVTSTGFPLLAFGAAVLWVASRPQVSVPLARVIIGLDVAWVVGTILLVFADAFTRAGALASLVVADVVLVFAVLQWVGVRRVRRASAPGRTPAASPDEAGGGLRARS
jgi:hypothetical protein